MSYFKYKMIRRDGQVLNGVVELPFNAASGAHEHFEERGLTVITVQRISRVAGELHSLISKGLRRRVRREELIELLRNMAVMLRSGVPILTAIDDVTAHSENPTLVKMAEDVRLSLESGQQLADATDRHPDIFPDAARHMIRIGEESGHLDRTLMDAAEHLERVHRITADTKKSLIYPCFVLTALLGATGFWVYFVIPAMSDLFRNLNVELPSITVFVLSTVDWLARNLAWMLAALVGSALTAVLCVRFVPWCRKRFHRLLTLMPVVGNIVRASNLAFIAEYFSLFISSGVDILSSLAILQQSLTNEVYKEKIAHVREGLMRGGSLTQELSRNGVFPSFIVRMIHVGELSGRLGEQLQYVAVDYRRRLKDTVDRLSEVVKPVTILVIGGLFVFVIVALFLPVYQLVGEISTRTTY